MRLPAYAGNDILIATVKGPKMQTTIINFLLTAILIIAAPHAGTVPDVFILGTNFSGFADWGTEPVFKNVLMHSREWISQRQGAGWGQGGPVTYDEDGYPVSLNADQWVEVPLMQTGLEADKTYLCLYDGQGTVEFGSVQEFTQVSPGRIEVRVRADSDPWLRIMSTTPGSHVRNIRFMLSENENSYSENPWRDDFLSRWQDFRIIRFMDWLQTNNSEISSWSERPGPAFYSASPKGAALEYMIDYCNRTLSHPWFCMPHLADDDYVRNFANVVRDNLDPRLMIYVEYSNEIWNSIFSQTQYCETMGLAQGLGEASRPWEAGWSWSGRRSGQIFDIWEEVFGGANRIIRVIGSQMNPYVGNMKLRQDSVWLRTDALAIAPYFGGHLNGDRLSEVESWTVDQILDTCLAHIRGGVRQGIQDFVDYLEELNAEQNTDIRLIAYEGGQHLSAWGMNQAVTDKFTAANRHPRMKDLYLEYFQQWQELGGALFCQFSSVSEPGVWGAWGVLERYDQTPEEAPKYAALLEILATQSTFVQKPPLFFNTQTTTPFVKNRPGWRDLLGRRIHGGYRVPLCTGMYIRSGKRN
jgi:hypothetical protein